MFFILDNPQTLVQTCHEGLRLGHFEQLKETAVNSIVPVQFEPELPDWFDQALAECEQGHVIDMDQALNEPPPRA